MTDAEPQREPREGTDDARVMAAYEAALTVATELDFPAVLQKIVDLSRTLIECRYAALSVTDRDGRVERFITSGLEPEERAAIGPLPEGRGLLGELVRRRRPMMLDDMQADPRSVGFPPNHPPMKTLLGVPILLGQRALGNLYLTEKLDGAPFNENDLRTVQIMAAHAATAIDRSWIHQQAELNSHLAEEQRDQLRVILDSLPAGVLIQGPGQGEIELVNNAAMAMLLGPVVPAGSLPVEGRDFALLDDSGNELEGKDRPAMRALAGETLRNRQMMIRRRDGKVVPVLVQAGPLPDNAGRVNRSVTVLQDITRLREAEQLKDDFISLISHELRTPATSIFGGAHVLRNQASQLDEAERAALLDDIVRESERLNQMMANLIGLASIQAGRLEPNTEPVLLRPLAARVAADVNRVAPDHRVVVEIDPSNPPVEADPNLLEQVLRNLVENAVKYSPDGGQITITAKPAGDGVSLEVRDEGVGIGPEHVGEVFDRFRRPGAPAGVRGMGLGLYLSRHLVEAQGGRISAASPGMGKGATFAVTLPVAQGWSDDSLESSGS